jgi:uncharacterized protein (DUF2249 family)
MTGEILLDVRDLAPPEPLQRVLGALDVLPGGHYLRVVHRRDPHCLLELLDQLGFVHEVRSTGDTRFDIFVWNGGDTVAALAVQKSTSE